MFKPYRVAFLDDDRSILDSSRLVLEASGLLVRTFEGASEFMRCPKSPAKFDCIVSDVMMPGITGLMLQQWLNEQQDATPLILITGHGQVDMAVQAMKAGAADFIQKPFDAVELAALINQLAEAARELASAEEAKLIACKRFATLTGREREVLALMIDGHASREISERLGIGIRTVETHRAAIMTKMEVRTTVELVRVVLRSDLKPVFRA